MTNSCGVFEVTPDYYWVLLLYYYYCYFCVLFASTYQILELAVCAAISGCYYFETGSPTAQADLELIWSRMASEFSCLYHSPFVRVEDKSQDFVHGRQ